MKERKKNEQMKTKKHKNTKSYLRKSHKITCHNSYKYNTKTWNNNPILMLIKIIAGKRIKSDFTWHVKCVTGKTIS